MTNILGLIIAQPIRAIVTIQVRVLFIGAAVISDVVSQTGMITQTSALLCVQHSIQHSVQLHQHRPLDLTH